MKLKCWVTSFLIGGLAMLLCSCAGFGTKFETPTDDVLVLGKLTPAEALKHFGQPYGKSTKATQDGVFMTYTYSFAHYSFGKLSSRVLLMEFKGDVLNGYYWWSSFNTDRTTVNEDAFARLQAGIGKLTRGDVIALAGKPNGKACCPTMLADFKQQCEKNTEAWGWYSEEATDVGVIKTPKIKQLIVTFNADGKVSSVETSDFTNWQRSGF